MESNSRAEQAQNRLDRFRAHREATAGTSTADLECAAVERLLDSGEVLAAELVLECFESFLEEAGE